MKASTPLLAAALLLAIGGATFWLAASSGEANVRQVEQVVNDPAAHVAGTFTLVGIPQPEFVPGTGPEGTLLLPNRDAVNATRAVVVWEQDDLTYHSVLTTTVATQGDVFLWTVRNETRVAGSNQLAGPATNQTFTLASQGDVFPVQAFDLGTGPLPAVWAWYDRSTERPLEPKPSQFIGRLLTHLPDGTPLPAGVLIWNVDSYLAACSSKFTPPEVAERYNLTE